MALTVRLSAREVEYLRDLLAEASKGGTAEGLVTKLENAELRAKTRAEGKGLAPQVAIEAFKEVLGSRLVAPLQGQYGQVGVLLRNLGLSRQQCISIAKTAKAEWRPGPIRALSLLRQADVLLQGAQGQLWNDSGRVAGGWQGAVPLEDE